MSRDLAADDNQEVVLVAVAQGARWPSWLDVCRGNSGAIVVAQQVGEPASQFATRVARRAGEASSPPLAAVLAVDERQHDVGELSAVAEVLGRSLNRPDSGHRAPAAAEGGARLLLTAHEEAAAPLRHALMSLAGSLCAALPGGTEVGVRFGGATTGEKGESGVFPLASSRAGTGPDRLLVG